MNQPGNKKMDALIWEAPSLMNMRQVEVPSIGMNEVLIQVKYAGICGSELSGYLGHNALRVPPLIMGHEFSGKIINFGDQALDENKDLQKGQSVTVNPMIYCGTCEFCLRGENQLCLHRKLIGAHLPGAFATFIKVPSKMVYPLPAGLELREGSLTEPVACAVRISKWAGEFKNDDILIMGAGTIGLMSLQVLLEKGASRVFIADIDEARLSAAGDLGGIPIDPRAENVVDIVRQATQQRGVIVSIDAVGKAVTRSQCIASTRSGGTVLLSGLHEESSQVPVADVIRREIKLQGSFCYSPEDFKQAVNLLVNRKVGLDSWIVEKPLEDGGLWFDQLSSDRFGGAAKVLLLP